METALELSRRTASEDSLKKFLDTSNTNDLIILIIMIILNNNKLTIILKIKEWF